MTKPVAPSITAVFASELRRAEAAELARAGDYDSAARILAPMTDLASQDLLARVHAQRGDLDAADRTWQQILVAEPGHAPALAGTRLIADIKAGKRRKRPLPVFALTTGAAAVVVLAGAIALVLLPGNETPVVSSQPVVTVTEVPPPLSSTPRVQPPLSLVDDLRAPGVQVSSTGDQVTVVFDDGLFASNGSQLTAAGRRRLTEWGRLLSGKKVKVAVLGHSLALGPGPTTGGSGVALDRASAAAQVLADSSGLPMTAFTAMSADQSAAPHLGSSPDKNRTVTLVVTPAR